jgi:hypothetical protein
MAEIISYKICAVKVRNAKLRNYLKINCLALWLDESAHASLAASCEELRARTGNPPYGPGNH